MRIFAVSILAAVLVISIASVSNAEICNSVIDSKNRASSFYCPVPKLKPALGSNMEPVKIEPVVVLFGINQYNLDQVAERALNNLIDAINEAGGSDRNMVFVLGHTDTSGPDTYNLHLSVRRASAVTDFLIEHGVSLVRTTTWGESFSAVDTGDNVLHPLNRRVVVEVLGLKPR